MNTIATCRAPAGFLWLLPWIMGCIGYRTPMDKPTAPAADLPVNNPTDAAAEPRRDAPGARAETAGDGRDARADVANDTAGAGADVRRDLGADLSRSDLPVDTRPLPNCTAVGPFVMLLAHDDYVYSFDPAGLALTALALVSCGTAGLNSMAVSPSGPAYISSQIGDLCAVELSTFRSTVTPFIRYSVNQSRYGMALLPDDVPAGQTLFIVPNASGNSRVLSRIDLDAFTLTTVGTITTDGNPMELTAGPNGELYGFSIGATSSLLINIDPKTGAYIDVTTVPAGYSAASFALVYWQDQFYLFLGAANTSSSDVYGYRKGESQVRHLGTLGVGIIGAGIAQCD